MESTEPNEIERPRSVAQIIGEALDIYQRYPLLFLVLALGVIAPYELAYLAATGSSQLASGKHGSAGVAFLFVLIDWVIVSPLISALHIHAVVQIGEGNRPRLVEVAKRGLLVLPVVAAASIVSGLGIGAGFIALIVPGVLLWLGWAVVAQVAAVEHEGWLPSLTRSRDLTRGHYRHILGLIVTTLLIAEGMWQAARAIPVGAGSGVAAVSLGITVRTLVASFTALTLAILYFDLRARAKKPAASATPEYHYPRDLD